MPEKPILIFPAATVTAREKLPPSFGPPSPRPSQSLQRKRLARRFSELRQQFGTVQSTTGGIDPEQVIVFETIGSISAFQNVVRKIPGLEWLGDFDADIAEPDPGFLVDGTSPAHLSGRLFVIASNRSAYNQVLRLWREWGRSADEKLPRGFGALAQVFKYLQDVRPWDVKDRVLSTGLIEVLNDELESGKLLVRFEAELWYRSEESLRAEAFQHLQATVNNSGGQCITQLALGDIDYHGVLLEMPAAAVREFVDAVKADTDTPLLRLTEVKYFEPSGQAAIAPFEGGESAVQPTKPLPTEPPVVALLDGLPLTNHQALQGRLLIDDPDDYASTYQVGDHRHGTAMASLIAHGELDANESALSSLIYCRPIMQPGTADVNGNRWETFSTGRLLVDTLHRAVRRIFEPTNDTPAQAPTVKIINLSVGDSRQLFDRKLSPIARLLDWLAWKYQVLFIVSAGNHLDEFSLPVPAGTIATLSDDDLRAHTLRVMAHQRVRRRLLAPAESVNALTIGASHEQSAPDGYRGNLVDLLRGALFASPINTVASGFRRAIKPDLLVPGGRRHYMPKLQPHSASTSEFQLINATGQPGQLVAAPGGTSVPPNYALRTSGTSNAAALTTRKAEEFVRRIEELLEEPGGNILEQDRYAVILKAMLVHGASWGDREAFLNQVFDGPDSGMERWWRIKRACAQLLGYGVADFDRGSVCTDERVILIGSDKLRHEQAHMYRVPLPTALHAQAVQRKLTITLAWMTPINPKHRDYRVADLWFDPPVAPLRLKRLEADHDSVCRGTLQHEVLAGQSAVPISENDKLLIQVNCRGVSSTTFTVPYCLLVSLETAAPLAVSIYEQVRVAIQRLRAATRVRPTVRGGGS